MRRFDKAFYASYMAVALLASGISSCSGEVDESEETTIETETAATTTTESSSESQTSEQTTSAVTEPTSQTIRETVYTDDEISVITHPEVLNIQPEDTGIQSVYNRPTEEYMDTVHLEYADGCIFPYISYYSSPESDYYGEYLKANMGIVDQHGTILSDGIYDSVHQAFGNAMVYYPIWVCANYSSGDYYYDLLAFDGTWFVDGDFNSVNFNDNRITTCTIDGNSMSVEAYDFEGNLCGGPVVFVPNIRENSRIIRYPIDSGIDYLFDDGHVVYYDEDEMGDRVCCILDSQGNQVSEFYATYGYNGRAMVIGDQFYSGNYGVMDSAGSLLIDKIYDEIMILPNGKFACVKDDTVKLFAEDYTLVKSFDGQTVTCTDDRLVVTDNNCKKLYIYDFDGNLKESYNENHLRETDRWLVKQNVDEDSWCIVPDEGGGGSRDIKVYNPYSRSYASARQLTVMGSTIVAAKSAKIELYTTDFERISDVSSDIMSGANYYEYTINDGRCFLVTAYNADCYEIYSLLTGNFLGSCDYYGRATAYGLYDSSMLIDGNLYFHDRYGTAIYNVSEGEFVFRYNAVEIQED